MDKMIAEKKFIAGVLGDAIFIIKFYFGIINE